MQDRVPKSPSPHCLHLRVQDVRTLKKYRLSGSLNIVSTTTNGKPILQFHPQGVSGVGQTTGTAYRGTGGTIIIGQQNDGETHTYVNNFNIIATKPAGISSIEHWFYILL